MTRHHYDPSELDRSDPQLDDIATELERYAAATSGEPPAGLAGSIMRAIDAEPAPRTGIAALVAGWAWPARSLAAVAVLTAAIVSGLALGGLLGQAQPDVGASPIPSLGPSQPAPPSPSPSASEPPMTPSSSPRSTPSSSIAPATPTAAPTARPATPAPTATDDDDDDDDDDEIETPEPSESDDDSSGSGSDD